MASTDSSIERGGDGSRLQGKLLHPGLSRTVWAMAIEQIGPKAAFDRMQAQRVPYLDVRTVEEYAAGHAAGAHNIPIYFSSGGRMVPNPEFVSEVRVRFAPENALIVGCRTGARSQKACELLEQEGFLILANDQGSFAGRPGILGWSQETSLPLEDGHPPGRAFRG